MGKNRIPGLIFCEIRRNKLLFFLTLLILTAIVTVWISISSIARQVPRELDEYAGNGRETRFTAYFDNLRQMEQVSELRSKESSGMPFTDGFPELGVMNQSEEIDIWEGMFWFYVGDERTAEVSEMNRRLLTGSKAFVISDNYTENIWVSDIVAERTGFCVGDVISLENYEAADTDATPAPGQGVIAGIYQTDQSFRYAFCVGGSVANLLRNGKRYELVFQADSVRDYWRDTEKLKAMGAGVWRWNEEEMKGYMFVIYGAYGSMGLVTVLLVGIVFLLVRQYLLRRQRYIALLRISGLSKSCERRYLCEMFAGISTVSFLLSMSLSPFFVRNMRNTIVDILGDSKISATSLSPWNLLLFAALLVITTAAVAFASHRIRRREIVQLMVREI